MTSHQATPLRLHVEEHPDEQFSSAIPQIAPLCSAFEKATGWELRFEQSPAGLGEAWSTTIEAHGQQAGRLILAAPRLREVGTAHPAAIDLHQARPLALETLENVFRLGPETALSGPIARGDVAVVARHLLALRPLAEIAALYRVTARRVSKVAAEKGRAGRDALLRIAALLVD